MIIFTLQKVLASTPHGPLILLTRVCPLPMKNAQSKNSRTNDVKS